MKKILIAFLGKQEYKETTYRIGEKPYKSQLAFIPVYKHLLSENLIKYSERFIKPSLWESHLEAAKFYIESKRPTQALLVLREVILTYRCEENDCDVYDLSSRNKIETEFNEQRQKSKEPIVKLWQKITDARNRTGHALMKRTNKDLSPTKAIKEVKSLIEQTEEILKGKK